MWTHFNNRLLEWSFTFDCFSFRHCLRLSVAVPLLCSRGCSLTSIPSYAVFLASIDPAWRQKKNHNLFRVVKRPVLWSFDPLEMTKCSVLIYFSTNTSVFIFIMFIWFGWPTLVMQWSLHRWLWCRGGCRPVQICICRLWIFASNTRETKILRGIRHELHSKSNHAWSAYRHLPLVLMCD